VQDRPEPWKKAGDDFRFAAGVAGFGLLLRETPQVGKLDWPLVADLAGGARCDDPYGHRSGFLRLVEMARTLQPER
jgi:Ca-activated chloride channel family protein